MTKSANYLEYGHEAQASSEPSHLGTDQRLLWVGKVLLKLVLAIKGGRTQYYHFVFSDPEDKASPSEVADMAAEWVEHAFPGSQWVAAVHDDNAGHIHMLIS